METPRCPHCGKTISSWSASCNLKCVHCGEPTGNQVGEDLINCPACTRKISGISIRCPHCRWPTGYVPPDARNETTKNTGTGQLFGVLVFLAIILVSLASLSSYDPSKDYSNRPPEAMPIPTDTPGGLPEAIIEKREDKADTQAMAFNDVMSSDPTCAGVFKNATSDYDGKTILVAVTDDWHSLPDSQKQSIAQYWIMKWAAATQSNIDDVGIKAMDGRGTLVAVSSPGTGSMISTY